MDSFEAKMNSLSTLSIVVPTFAYSVHLMSRNDSVLLDDLTMTDHEPLSTPAMVLLEHLIFGIQHPL